MDKNITLETGTPWPLGAHADADGVNFAVFSAHASQVDLCLFDAAGEHELHRLPLPGLTDQVWHGRLPDAGPGLLYGYRVYGPYEPARGHRFNPHKLLLDPYARDYQGVFVWSDAHYGYTLGSEHGADSFDNHDNAAALPKCRVVDGAFDWQDDAPPATPLAETVIYEMHVKGFTRRLRGVPADLRGTYAGLTHPAAVDHLHELGVTAVELLPVHAFIDEPNLATAGQTNYWGYNTIGFFAPMARYAHNDDAIAEFKGMVKALHAASIEVILDVVYNHSAEGGELGPTLSFRGLDNASYYHLLADDPRYYLNHSGCGNTLDAAHPRVLQMIMDSLRYWVTDFHVDGFRFDLAPCLGRCGNGFDPRAPFLEAVRQDPVLQHAKLIAEPWDVGLGGYQVGAFPPGWSEWNDRFRDDVRDFWLGREQPLATLAWRLGGSSDLFARNGRTPQASVNAVTMHDGFNLADLVAQATDNSDGDEALQAQLRRNLVATTVLSLGVPMILAGDEIGHSRDGNHNAYNQDNETTWLDWAQGDAELLAFTRRLIALRRANAGLRRGAWLRGERNGDDEKDVVWLDRDGREKTAEEWDDPSDRCLGMLLSPWQNDAAWLIAINDEDEPIDFALPDGQWHATLDTARPDASKDTALDATIYPLQARSLALLQRLG